MELPSYTTFILNLMSQIDLATKSFIDDGYHQLANYLARPVALGCTVLIALTGYGMLMGFIKMSTSAFHKLAITIGGVYLFAFGWAEFSAYFIGLFLHVANEIAGLMIGGNSFQFPLLSGTGTGLNAALQTVLIEAVKVGGWVMGKAGFTDWLPLFIGLIFILCGTFVVALAAIEIIVVKLYLAMLLAVAPFFISCLLFPQTKAQFEGWLNQLKGFAIALMLLGVAIGLCMYLMHWVVGGYFIEKALSVKLYSIVPLIIATLLCALLLTGIIPIAKHIGGSHGGSGWGAVGGAIVGAGAATLAASSKTARLSQSSAKALRATTSKSGLNTKASYSNIRNHLQRGQ